MMIVDVSSNRQQPEGLGLAKKLRNSGKTFGALQDLLAAPSGLYMAPLRLLAWEIYEKMDKAAALVKGLRILNPQPLMSTPDLKKNGLVHNSGSPKK